MSSYIHSIRWEIIDFFLQAKLCLDLQSNTLEGFILEMHKVQKVSQVRIYGIWWSSTHTFFPNESFEFCLVDGRQWGHKVAQIVFHMCQKWQPSEIIFTIIIRHVVKKATLSNFLGKSTSAQNNIKSLGAESKTLISSQFWQIRHGLC